MKVTLTEAERKALWIAHTYSGPHFDRIVAATEAIVGARVEAERQWRGGGA